MSSSAQDHHAAIERLRARINKGLQEDVELGGAPDRLYGPTRYVLDGDGKRLRPILLLLTAQAFGSSVKKALPAALAIEIFHNFTLVHDDIMDEAQDRRGRATVHTKWDNNVAILVGDLLLALSYEQLHRVPRSTSGNPHTSFNQAVRKLCEGQTLDLVFEDRDNVSVEEYLEMIDLKTGALLALSFELGGFIGQASHSQRQSLASAGRHIGRAFQIRDDLLDLTAEDEGWGKTIGGDLISGKKTFLVLTALDKDPNGLLRKIVDEDGLDQEDIPKARERFEELGVLESARNAIEEHTRLSREHLTVLPDNEASQRLMWLLQQMQSRVR